MFTKTCRECKTVYEYNNESELKQFFYKKQSWFMNTCRQCTCAHHRKMYSEGFYGNEKVKKIVDEHYTVGGIENGR